MLNTNFPPYGLSATSCACLLLSDSELTHTPLQCPHSPASPHSLTLSAVFVSSLMSFALVECNSRQAVAYCRFCYDISSFKMASAEQQERYLEIHCIWGM